MIRDYSQCEKSMKERGEVYGLNGYRINVIFYTALHDFACKVARRIRKMIYTCKGIGPWCACLSSMKRFRLSLSFALQVRCLMTEQ
jgi:hypothetical protein